MSPEVAALVARYVESLDPTTGPHPRINVRAECAALGISKTMFYKYVARFQAEGVDGFFPRTRRPLTSPERLTAACEDELIRARKELLDGGWDAGADQIRFRLQAQIDAGACSWPASQPLPSRATINRVLDRRGQLVKVPQRRPRAARRRFEADQPNQRWQMDGFEWTLASGWRVVVLHVIDDCSRYEIALQVARSENAEQVWDTLTLAAGRYGLPAELLTDNGTAFSGRRRGWTSPLEANLTQLGVRHVTSRVGHPQTCGKVERAHQPVQRWLETHGPYETVAELQAALDAYRQQFNHDRPKTHLGGLTPAQRYALGDKAAPAGPVEAPLHLTRGKVAVNGTVTIHRTRVGIGRAHAGKTVTLFRRGTRVTVFDSNRLVVEFDLKSRAGYQSANPRGRKVSAMS
ncbi:IS481 family transposase [Nocardioides sp. YIM 152588]|uniref:IS481 family transposase n=1 Tax=Nocardioides sp. YIM 152588 TaxID=3158259 RepID=UPI0032E4D7F6